MLFLKFIFKFKRESSHMLTHFPNTMTGTRNLVHIYHVGVKDMTVRPAASQNLHWHESREISNPEMWAY